MAQQRINLVNLLRNINELQREVEAPKFNKAIIHPDYLILHWNEIHRVQWGSFPEKIPIITSTCIEYKKMVDSTWIQIKTNSNKTNSLCFYKNNPIHNFSSNHQNENYIWNQYNALEEDSYYDIRLSYENYHENKRWTTISSIGIPTLPPTFNFCGFLKKKIENPLQNQCYLILENQDPEWKEYKNCITMFVVSSSINGWVIYYPRKDWLIDNYYFNGEEWIDIKLKNSLINLNKTIPSKDILFKIINHGFIDRFFNDNMLKEYYEKYIN